MCSLVVSEKSKIFDAGGRHLEVANWDKVYFPEDNVTKGDVISYYSRMYKYILPYLKDRPESLRRNPEGITSKGFFQKNAPKAHPKWVKTFTVLNASGNKSTAYIICNDTATLLYLNNLGCIEINPWFSRIQLLDNPDYMALDIDPSPRNTFDEVVDVALAIKQIMDKVGAVSFCKTSGATGLHVYVPLGARYDYATVRSFAKRITGAVHQLLPDTTSMERSLDKRGNKIYLDYLQNNRGQTLVCPYSLRPRIHATVSTPLLWKEVKHRLDPEQFTIKTIEARIEKLGDLFSGVLGKGIDFRKCQQLLDS